LVRNKNGLFKETVNDDIDIVKSVFVNKKAFEVYNNVLPGFV